MEKTIRNIKRRVSCLCRYLPWLFLLLGVDAMAALLLWISEAEAFEVLLPMILLGTVLLFTGTAVVLGNRELRREEAFQAFLDNPDLIKEEDLLRIVSKPERESVRLLGTVLREKDLACSRAKADAEDYEEYVEAWAHETKTPLSLLTMVLDNQREEIPAPVAFKLEYIRSRLQEHISQILYYARLKSGRKDYFFEYTDLKECIEEVLEDYSLLLTEKNFQVSLQVPSILVFTDRRGIRFLIGQIVSNAVKYCRDLSDASENPGRETGKNRPELKITLESGETKDILHIRDNGIGVKECDMPYIFEKGFTGDSTDPEKKATGMGLYLSRKMANDLNLGLEAWSERGKGFEMKISFPRVESKI